MQAQKTKTNIKKIAGKTFFLLMLTNLFAAAVFGAPAPQWPTPATPEAKIIANAPGEQNRQQIVKTSDGNFIVAWADQKSGLYRIYAEKSDPWGKIFWNPENPGSGIPIAMQSMDGDQPNHELKIAADPDPENTGGSFIAWDATDQNRTTGGVFIKKLDMLGNVLPGWDAIGNQIQKEGSTYLKALINDAAGGAYVAWILDNENKDLYLAHIRKSDGAIDPLWNSGQPLVIATQVDPASQVKLIRTNANEVIVAYSKLPYLEVTKLSSTGTKLWAPAKRIYDLGQADTEMEVISDQTGGLYAAYTVFNGQDQDIKAQHLNSSGTLLWENGTDIVTQNGNQNNLKLASDNVTPTNGVIITWQDFRGSTSEIYAQHIDSEGKAYWEQNGIAVSYKENNLNKETPQIVSNGNDGAIIIYLSQIDGLPYKKIMAHQISGSGLSIWPAEGITVDAVPRYIQGLEITGDNIGGAAVSWEGTNTTSAEGTPEQFDILAQFVNDPQAPPAKCLITSQSETQASYCAQLQLIDPILTFLYTPSSFTFNSINITGSKVERFNNLPGVSPQPYSEDLLGVQDTRSQGGFVVQMQASGNFTEDANATQQISLTNCQPTQDNSGSSCLYAISTTTSDYIISGSESQEIIDGVIYIPSGQTQMNIVANLNADGGGNLNQASTYYNNGGNLGSQNILELMTGTLPTSSGRNGKFYQYISYLLKIPGLPAVQPTAGNYAVTITFTLMESNS